MKTMGSLLRQGNAARAFNEVPTWPAGVSYCLTKKALLRLCRASCAQIAPIAWAPQAVAFETLVGAGQFRFGLRMNSIKSARSCSAIDHRGMPGSSFLPLGSMPLVMARRSVSSLYASCFPCPSSPEWSSSVLNKAARVSGGTLIQKLGISRPPRRSAP